MRVKIITLKFINGVKGEWSEYKHASWNFSWGNFGQKGLVLASVTTIILQSKGNACI